MQKVSPFLWFDNNAEEAMEFYKSVFKDVKISIMGRYPEGSPMPAGTAVGGVMELFGTTIMLLNGGPSFKLTEAISLYVNCEDQAEVDEYWEKLTADDI